MPIPPIPGKPESWTKSGSGLKPKNETTVASQVSTMSTTERDALTPVNGMIINNLTTNQLEKYEASSWSAFA